MASRSLNGAKNLAVELTAFANEHHLNLSPRICKLIEGMRVQRRSLDELIGAFDEEIMSMAREGKFENWHQTQKTRSAGKLLSVRRV